MKLSQLFTKTMKDVAAAETSRNAQLLTRAGYVQKVLAGVYTYLPLGLRVLRKIERVVREEMDAIGGQEILMPSLQPKESWVTTGRWDTLDVLFKVPGPEDSEYALAPTHEEVVVPAALKFIQSYRDLPFAAYQIQTKFRKEVRAKSGLMRGREFLMKDLYSFHTDADDLQRFYDIVALAYERVFTRLGLDAVKVMASGGTFSKFSHEYQVLTPNGEDEVYLCKECNLALNKEIVLDHAHDPKGHPWDIQHGSEVGNIFLLNTKFTAPFDGTYSDEQNVAQPIYMGCYGIGISRLMGVIAEVYNDDAGLAWPAQVAPYQVHLASLGEGAEVRQKALELYELLRKSGLDVLWDDRDLSPGAKFADADLLGLPFRIVISERSLAAGGVEVKGRADAGKGTVLPIAEAVAKAEALKT